ncbi:autoinducer binding domain-containing protein [Methylobacterium phyllostachyos]|uniref:autoinducer binding domain-containing protein n=1 Tax=Methylobacterium phyllostachyos TaxID=582672 RepID=UPI000B80D802
MFAAIARANGSRSILISGWPRAWTQRHRARGVIHVGPVPRHLKGVVDPFLWRVLAGQARGRA